jgi:hypothetical protein
MYNIVATHLYTQPPFDYRFGSPLPRFLAFLKTLPTLSLKTQSLIATIDLEHIEATLYEEVPETWLYLLAMYCPRLTTLRTSELSSFLNQSAINYLKPNALASLRKLDLVSPVDLSEAALCRLIEAASALQELQIVDCNAAGVAVSEKIKTCLSGTLRLLTLRKCPKFNDSAVITLLLQSGGIPIVFPRLEMLKFEQLALTNSSLLLLAKSDTYRCLSQLTHLSLNGSVNVGTEGILAFINQRRNTIINTTNLAHLPVKELTSFDLRRLPKVSSVLLAHLLMEASYLQRLYVDIDFLRVSNNATMQQQNSICASYTWALARLQLFHHLNHLVIDVTNTARLQPKELAAIEQYIRHSLVKLKTLTFIDD